jgi:hypothetical protein
MASSLATLKLKIKTDPSGFYLHAGGVRLGSVSLKFKNKSALVQI